MVTVISGGSHSGRDKVFIDKIKSAVKNGEQVMVIIPDQFSFEYDKKLYEHLGAADFNVIQTAGFNRIAEFTEKLMAVGQKKMPMITSALSLCIRLSDVLSRPRISAFIKRVLKRAVS